MMDNMEYYSVYMTYHQNSGNRAVHLLGNIATLVFALLCLAYSAYWWLLATPFIVYLFAYPGHWFLEGNNPAGFRNPIKAKLCDWLMCYRMITRQPLQ